MFDFTAIDLDDAPIERPGYPDPVYGLFVAVALPQEAFAMQLWTGNLLCTEQKYGLDSCVAGLQNMLRLRPRPCISRAAQPPN